ncbi:hypothetical protein B0H11DRAFT_467577 [Mycena galericulata]|nr:hypothetical protein B0H11DRAFT_467577 [Mycena galericulata]
MHPRPQVRTPLRVLAGLGVIWIVLPPPCVAQARAQARKTKPAAQAAVACTLSGWLYAWKLIWRRPVHRAAPQIVRLYYPSRYFHLHQGQGDLYMSPPPGTACPHPLGFVRGPMELGGETTNGLRETRAPRSPLVAQIFFIGWLRVDANFSHPRCAPGSRPMHWDDWERGAPGRPNIWSRADNFGARKRSGETNGDRSWLEEHLFGLNPYDDTEPI